MKASVRSYSLRELLERQCFANDTAADAIGQGERLVGARNDKVHRTVPEFRWIIASSRVEPQNR